MVTTDALTRVRGAVFEGIPASWRLHPESVRMIRNLYGRAEVDLFATSEKALCPLFFSLSHSPLEGDALTSCWPAARLYAFHSIQILPLVLYKIRKERASVILIAPNLPWFPDLTELLVADPHQEGFAIPGGRLGVAPEPGVVEPSCVAASGISERLSALHSRVLEHPLWDVCMPSTKRIGDLHTFFCGQQLFSLPAGLLRIHFARFYKLDVQSLASPVLSVSDWFMFCNLYSQVLLLAQELLCVALYDSAVVAVCPEFSAASIVICFMLLNTAISVQPLTILLLLLFRPVLSAAHFITDQISTLIGLFPHISCEPAQWAPLLVRMVCVLSRWCVTCTGCP